MKSINTLVQDIYEQTGKQDGWLTSDAAAKIATAVSSRLVQQYQSPPLRRGLRLSGLGPRCPRALWFSINKPELAEALPPWANIKYSFGHIIEAMAVELARAAGHEVTGEQDELVVDGIKGHRDCVIDGCVVDVKSSSSRGFIKFKDGSIAQNDQFGYLEQLDGYLVGSLNDPSVRVHDKGYLLVVDKQLGHLALYEHTIREAHIRRRIKDYKAIVALDKPPACTCETVPDGKSGNIRLGTKPSYSAFKFECFPHLRTFLYASGPVYLTKVVRKPDVIEVDRHGKVVYN